MAMKVAVFYASKHGSTEGIAAAIAQRLQDLGFETHLAPVSKDPPLLGIGAVVLGSAVYAGSWMKEAVSYAEDHTQELSAVPVWLFSSGPLGTEVEDEEEQPRQLPDLQTRLSPRGHRVFFGALDRDQLGFGERMLVKAVKAPDGDFRDWAAIDAWADEVAGALG